MQIDLAQAGIEQGSQSRDFRADVCIVGGGIAGLLLADRLCTAGLDVILLEAGGPGLEPAEQDLAAAAQLTGEPHLGSAQGRTRALGGSSLTWGGQLLPLPDEANWPVTRADLEPHYSHIHRLLGVNELSYAPEPFFSALAEPIAPILNQLPRLVPRLSKFAPFGKRNLAASLGRKLLKHRRARVLLHAQASEVELNPAADRVEAVWVQTSTGKRLRVHAQHTVIAAGTVETSRLLLLSRSRQPRGVGNQHDQVGRNFHDHLTIEVARFHGAARDRAIALFRPWLLGGLHATAHSLKLEAHHEMRRKLGLGAALAHVTFEEPEHSGLGALRDLLRSRQKADPSATVPSMSRLSRAVMDLVRLEREALVRSRRYVSPLAAVALRVNVAQQTPSRSRVMLQDAPGPDGLAQVRLDWHHAAADLRTIRVMAGYVRKCLAPLGFDEVDGVIWRRDVTARHAAGWIPGTDRSSDDDLTAPIAGLEDARHAMGGACMGTDPRQSVVDPHLRVHGMANLWIASAAVFPDGAPQLPSLTLMALTLRLAGKLERVLRS